MINKLLFLSFCVVVVLGCKKTDQPLFNQTLDRFVFRIDRGIEIESGKNKKLLNVTVYKKGEIFGACLPFYLPEEIKVVDLKSCETDQHICVSDSQGMGFIVIFCKDSGEFFVSRTTGPRGGLSTTDFERWKVVYSTLKVRFKDLPYSEYFE